jgi:AcrR family transcriptional regulator
MARKQTPYHHGDLRTALLRAGEDVLAETGAEGFSLREVARRVGVSHAAPSHHFGDAKGLLAALAAEGFRRFLAAMRNRQAGVGSDPRALLLASSLGYLDFVRESPALFRLMFGDDRIQEHTPELATAADDSFLHLASDIERLLGVSPFTNSAAMARAMAVWSVVHGFAGLLNTWPVEAISREQQDLFFEQACAPLMEPLSADALAKSHEASPISRKTRDC